MHLLLLGACYRDIVISVPVYPEEDAKVAASAVVIRRGGNAANTACVMGTLMMEDHISFCSTWPAVQQCLPEFNDLLLHHVDPHSFAIHHPDKAMPEAYIIHSLATQSRTIMNHHPLPQVSSSDFLCLTRRMQCDWVHFEGRPNNDLLAMVMHCHDRQIAMSLECEKPQRFPILKPLLPFMNVIFYSKTWAEAMGASSAMQYLNSLDAANFKQGCYVFCTWGAEGAAARVLNHNETTFAVHVQPLLNIPVVETIGAGDSFIAGILTSLQNTQFDLTTHLKFGCWCAAGKCTQSGFNHLKTWLNETWPDGATFRVNAS